MPSRKLHEQLCKFVLGRGYAEVHRFMDYPSRWLGKRHRQLFHDLKGCVLAWLLTGDYKGFLAAYLHILLDNEVINPEVAKLFKMIRKTIKF